MFNNEMPFKYLEVALSNFNELDEEGYMTLITLITKTNSDPKTREVKNPYHYSKLDNNLKFLIFKLILNDSVISNYIWFNNLLDYKSFIDFLSDQDLNDIDELFIKNLKIVSLSIEHYLIMANFKNKNISKYCLEYLIDNMKKYYDYEILHDLINYKVIDCRKGFQLLLDMTTNKIDIEKFVEIYPECKKLMSLI